MFISLFLGLLILVSVFILVEKRTGLISYMDGEFRCEGMQKELLRNEEKVSREYIERRIFRGLTPKQVPLKTDQACIDYDTIRKYERIGVKRVRYYRKSEIYFDVLYDYHGKLIYWWPCYD